MGGATKYLPSNSEWLRILNSSNEFAESARPQYHHSNIVTKNVVSNNYFASQSIFKLLFVVTDAQMKTDVTQEDSACLPGHGPWCLGARAPGW